MITRVTSSSTSSVLSSQIGNHYSKFANLTSQITTGKKINSLLDDPVNAVNIVSSNRQLNKIGVWTANVASVSNEVKQSSETIELVINKAQRAKDLATTAATGTSTKSALEATLSEIDQMIMTAVDLANVDYNGSYIYSGANIKTPPYQVEYGIDADGKPTKEIVGVKYTGTPITSQWERRLEVANDQFERINVTGIEAFGDYDCEPILDADKKPVLDADGNPTYKVNSESGVFGNLLELRKSIKTTIDNIEKQENLPKDATEDQKKEASAAIQAGYKSINATIDGFTDSIKNMSLINSRFGALMNQMEMSTESLKNSENNLKEHISGIQDLDITQAMTDWYNAQYAYQASMQATTSIMSMSLLNYLN